MTKKTTTESEADKPKKAKKAKKKSTPELDYATSIPPS